MFDRKVPVITPPVALEAKDKDTLWFGIQSTAARVAYVKQEDFQECANVHIIIRESDAAKTNLAVVARERAEKPHAILRFNQCYMHQFHLVCGAVQAAVTGPKLKMMGNVFTSSHLLRTPGYIERIMALLPFVVSKLLVRTCVERPPALHNTARFALAAVGARLDDPGVRLLLTAVNGCWAMTDRIEHLCSGCCANRDDSINLVVRGSQT